MKINFWKYSLLLAVASLGGITANAADYYVKAAASVNGTGSSWSSPYTAEQFAEALLTAPKGTTFYLSEGVYSPVYNRSGIKVDNKTAFYYADEAVSIIGGFPKDAKAGAVADPYSYPTIINGDLKNDDVATVDEDGSVSITNKSDNHSLLLSISVSNGGKVVLKNLVFRGSADTPQSSPAAVVINGSSMSGLEYMDEVEIENCTFENCCNGVNLNDIYEGEIVNCQFTNIKSGAINFNRLEGMSFKIEKTTVENAHYGINFGDTNASLLMYNSTFINAPLAFDVREGIANQRHGLYNNTFIDVYPSKKSHFSKAFKYQFVGNIFGDVDMIDTKFEEGDVMSYGNLFFTESSVPSFYTDDDKAMPREYIEAILDGSYNKTTSVFTPNPIRLGSLGRTVSVVGDSYRDGSIRFDRSKSSLCQKDQREKDREDMTCPGAVEMKIEVPVFDCADGTILFKEDFGGNSVYDPYYAEEGLDHDFITLPYNGAFPLDTERAGVYGLRKEAIRRRALNDGREHSYDGWWADFGDHTSENDLTRGYMLQIDMSEREATFYKIQIDDLCENTNLYLSMWGHAVYNKKNTEIMLSVEDIEGNVLQKKKVVLDCNNNNWEQYGMEFTVPLGQTSIVYKIYSEGGHDGNDFCLDDIEVRLCKPKVNIEKVVRGDCIKSYSLTADYDNIGGYVNPIEYTWFKNDKNTYELTGWEKVGKGRTFEVKDVTSNSYYRCVVSSHGTEAKFDRCNSASDMIALEVEECGKVEISGIPTDSLCASGYDTLWASFNSSIYPDAKVNYKWYICFKNSDNIEDWTEIGNKPYWVLHNPTDEAIGNVYYRCVVSIGSTEPTLGSGWPESEIIKVYFGSDDYEYEEVTINAGETYKGKIYDVVGDYTIEEKIYPKVSVNSDKDQNNSAGGTNMPDGMKIPGIRVEDAVIVDTTACPTVIRTTLHVIEKKIPDTINITGVPIDYVCIDQTVILTADLLRAQNSLAPADFVWYRSSKKSNDPNDWEMIHRGSKLELSFDGYSGCTYYRCVVAYGGGEVSIAGDYLKTEIIPVCYETPQIIEEEKTIYANDTYNGVVYNDPGVYTVMDTVCSIVTTTTLIVEKNNNYNGSDVQCNEILFKEDFGGNDVNAQSYSKEGLLRGNITLPNGMSCPMAIEPEYRPDDLNTFDTGCYSLLKDAYNKKQYPRNTYSNHIYGDWYADFDDHTSEGDETRGYMLQIDMSDMSATFYNVQIDDLEPNIDLELSMWARNVNSGVGYDSKIKMAVTNLQGEVLVENDVVLLHDVYEWRRYALDFVVPEGETSVIFKIWSPGGHKGNDFCLDDIYVYKDCGKAEPEHKPELDDFGTNIDNVYSNDNVIFPNPTSGVLNVNIAYESASITDLQGREFLVANGEKTIDVSSLSSGCYLLRIISAEGSSIYKFIKE